MRPSLRFLTLAVIGWAGVRAATLGVLPGGELFRIDRSEARAPPIVPTQFPAIEPIEPAAIIEPSAQFAQAPIAPVVVRPVTVPVIYAAGYSAPAAYPTPLRGALPTPQPLFYSPVPALDEWPLSRIAASSLPPLRQSTVLVPGQSIPAQLKRSGIDRVQLTTWALLRGQRGAIGPSSLASGGQLGGSQAGARLAYNFTRQIAATLRTTSDVGRRGGEVAAGVRIQPAAGIPLWFTAERRQRLGRYGGGRNAFAFSSKAASTTGRCRCGCRLTPICRAASWVSAAATALSTGR